MLKRALLATIFLAGVARADVELWQLGGNTGLGWDGNDTTQVFIDFSAVPGSVQPVIFDSSINILSARDNWSPFKFPTELDYVDGSIPRIWRAANGFYWFTAGVLTPSWVDGDSLSYSPPVARGAHSEWYTIDIGVPVPASVVGFFAPPRGFRADGTLLVDDIVPAFELSVAEDFAPQLDLENNDHDYHKFETLIADVQQNFASDIQIDIPPQYLRFIRYRRNQSILDTQFARGHNNQQSGTIGEFVVNGQGVARRVFYISKIIDLGRTVNFGRLFWSATPMRVIDGVPAPVEDANASLTIEVRSGRDADPNVYHEFTDTGGELIVSRERYETELKRPDQQTGGQIQEGKPGLRASVLYDQDNWTFWSFPITQSGQPAPLERGSHLQVRLNLLSDTFFDFVRIDSLWIETSPPLAQQVVGELARFDDPAPARGLTEVRLGERTDFTYDLRAEFTGAGQQGFDAIKVRTSSRPQFKQLLMGAALQAVEPLAVTEGEDELIVQLPERITRGSNEPIRLVFGTEVYVFANTFTGEVFDTESSDLPQLIEEGDVRDEVNSASLQVYGLAAGGDRTIQDLRFSSGVVTPNGDGANDELRVEYQLFKLPQPLPVELVVYSLDGREIARIDQGVQGAGPQIARWDGKAADGKALPPGLYLLDLSIRSELKDFRYLRAVGVAY